MITKIYTFIQKHALIKKGDTIIIGLSGGPDSVFLLHSLLPMHHAGTIKLIAAHLDHQWRETSADDAQWCKQLCHCLSVPFVTTTSAQLTHSIPWNGSKEAYARRARRLFLQHVKKQYNAAAIALAHHRQDQIETFFIRLIRGTSLTGLVGMKPHHGHYIRPLLETSKDDIVAYLNNHSIAYLVDSTNTSDDYLRNRIRNQLLPVIQQIDPRSEHNMRTTIARLAHLEDFLVSLTTHTWNQISIKTLETTRIKINDLFTLHPALRNRVLIYWLIHEQVSFTPTEKFLSEILRFLQQRGDKTHELHHTWTIVKENEYAYVRKKMHTTSTETPSNSHARKTATDTVALS